MNDNTQIMTFCPDFFDDSSLQFSNRVLNDCPTINLRDAQFTKAAVIVHEATHTSYAMRGGERYVLCFCSVSKGPADLSSRTGPSMSHTAIPPAQPSPKVCSTALASHMVSGKSCQTANFPKRSAQIRLAERDSAAAT